MNSVHIVSESTPSEVVMAHYASALSDADKFNKIRKATNVSLSEVQAKLKELFNDIEHIGGEEMNNGKPMKDTYDSPRSYCTKAIEDLGLSTYSIEDTLRDTGNSYVKLGLL